MNVNLECVSGIWEGVFVAVSVFSQCVRGCKICCRAWMTV